MLQRCRVVSTLSLAALVLGCLGFSSHVHAQATQIKPWFLLVVDTSGSMCETDVNISNTCGFPKYIKMNTAKCAIQKILNSVGDADFGLEQFAQNQDCSGASCVANSGSGYMRVAISSTGAASILPLVDGVGAPTGDCNNSGTTIANGDNTQELCAGGGTPLGGALQKAREYFNGTYAAAGGMQAPTHVDGSAIGCRPISVILLTDGMENCTASAPTDAASLLNNTFVPTPSRNTACSAAVNNLCIAQPIKTYVIGFGITAPNTAIENIATSGGTDNQIDGAGGQRGYYASDQTTLSAALNQIILESQLTETCNGKDDDCDTRVDEGYPKYCDLAGLRTNNNSQPNLSSYTCPGGVCQPVPGKPGDANCAAPEYALSSTCTNPQPNLLCVDPGEKCNVIDDDCDGKVDEGAPALVGVNDGCDLKDNDCDGTVDENCNPNNCSPEVCDGADNDCDGNTDENLTQRCGTDEGECTAGTQICQGGQYGAVNPMTGTFQVGFCPDTKPTTEICDNKDNDCDGVIDRITRACSPYGTTLECTSGIETCIAGKWQYSDFNNPAQCIGAKGPSTEICDGKNNDCNVSTADGSADSRVGQSCGNGKGICVPGVTVCTAGNVVCNDPNEATTETCNGMDDDCDGSIDENTLANPLPGVGSSCFPGMSDPPSVVGECRLGMKACVGGALVCQNYKLPSTEVCDGKDNDCNASTADGSADPQLNLECGTSTGECDPGHNVCSMGGIVCMGGKGPVNETCNGKDDDCDFKTDEQIPGTGTDCDVAGGLGEAGACEFGKNQCVKTGATTYAVQCVGGVGPTLETCDGVDNDCDGATDECAGAHNTQAWMDCNNFMLRGTVVGPLGAGGGKVCGTDVADCETGVTKCVADVHPGVGSNNEPGYVCTGNVDGVPETCNGKDDDCDTKTDEALDANADPNLEQPCSDGVTIPACRETADPTEPCGRCHFGHTACVLGAVTCTGQVGAASFESCNGTDDDCDGTVDECVDPSGANCGNTAEIDPATPVGQVCAAGQCQSGINKCINGQLSCEGVVSGNVEVCNNLDDDCDSSIDEGFNKGAPCTESGEEAVGECRPGMIACDPAGGGGTVCINEIKPTEEKCNSLDDDCDRVVDEGLGLGEACGSEVGLCEQGKLACVGGRQVCSGEVGPRPETCDCQDNDCDGKVDEESSDEPLCAVGQCVMCQCALPCAPQMEFAARCPQGKAPVEENGQCSCVGEQCKQAECAKETIEKGDQVRCAPDDPKTGSCVCQNNECTFRCAGVTCDGGRVCDPTDGKCKLATCLLQQFGCQDGERCTMLDSAWTCVADDCADKTCGADQACRDGDCVASCAHVTCGSGERCVDGTCEKNPCSGVSCDAGEVCNPADGSCVLAGACVRGGCGDGQICDVVGGDCEEDPCLRTHCPRGEKCDTLSGQCAPLCGGKLLFCGDKCVDPTTSREHCGAKGDCLGGNEGQVCEKGLVCSLGECSDTCADNLVNCGGECVNPATDVAHCGASADCKGDNAGALCRTGTTCMEGECVSITPGGGDSGSGGKGGGKKPDYTRVIASGGGGCTCNVPGSASGGAPSSKRGALASLLLALIAAGLGRRRRRRARELAPAFNGPATARRGGALVRALLVIAGWLLVIVLTSSCKVDTFCIDCPKPGENPNGPLVDGGDFTNADGGTGVHTTPPGGRDASTGDKDGSANDRDAMVMRPDGGCVDKEICNGVDDDCDGKVDEDTDPAAENIDVNTDALNCGKCGNQCALPHAFNKCTDATCAIDTTQGVNGCDVGFFNLDKDDSNGCEYRCTKTADDDTQCDLIDNDCNGEVDEDVDLKTDALNCGACGYRCTFSNAMNGGVCQNGTCSLDSTKCDEGYADSDDKDANGCEYKCPVFPIVTDELCNFVDDDCDHKVDEDVATSDPKVGAKCGSPADDPDRGACVAGHYECQAGIYACVDAVGPEVEVCDGIDNDCDGVVDSDHPDIGLPCNVPVPGSECQAGTLRIPGGAAACAVGAAVPLECFGGKGPVDETCNGLDDDCDGEVDEADSNGLKPQEDQDCVNATSGVATATINTSEWAAVTGAWTAKTLCKAGKTACVGGTLLCKNEVAPEPYEQCDNVDHDCDGQTLNGFTFTGGVTTTGPDPIVGDACGKETGECAFGTMTCHQSTATITCDNQVLPKAELCNGLDDDCDGQIDELTPTPPAGVGDPCKINSDGSMSHGAGVTTTGTCVLGTTVCAAGTLACPDFVGPVAELCDNIDQDCDNVLAEASYPADNRIGASCDTDGKTQGICATSGTQFCSTQGGPPHIACQGEVFPATELCDGLDNDCNPATADGATETWIGAACKTVNGAVMLSPAAAKGTCSNGTAQCVGGHQTCVGEVGPALETCDVQSTPADLSKAQYDQDCDGTVDEDFTLQTNVSKCGTCGNDCATAQPHANMQCVAGACQITSCKSGYYDSKLIPGADCSLHDGVDCTFTGQEVCDGKDNDCDAIADESTMAEPMFMPTAANFCLQLGKCATSTVVCRTHKLADLDNTSCTGYGDATCKTEPVCTIRPTAEQCNAPYNAESSSAYDDDCDGNSDLVEFNLNATCNAPGVGECATQGNLACDTRGSSMSATDTYCVNAMGAAVTTGAKGNESVCNNKDDDCDGHTDEACGLAGSDANCVNGDSWVTLPGGTQIYAYEASRRDATSASAGAQTSRACSVVGVQPWTNLTWDEASDACRAADPNGRLCTEEEWQAACQGGSDVGTNSCTWSFSAYAAAPTAGCNVYANATCNGLDFTPSGSPIEPTGWTGTPATSSTCYRPYAGGNVFDLSGNVKEYVEERLDNAIPVRGGAYNNNSTGISCGFDYTIWPNPDVAKFSNVGFRCCRNAAVASHCVTVKADDTTMPVVAAGGNNSTDDLDASLTVSLPGSGLQITDVDAIVKGFHGDFEDVRIITLTGPDNTVVTLRNNLDNTCTSGVDGFDLYFDDQGAAALSCTAPTGGGIPMRAQTGVGPATFSSTALAAFNGKDPEGTWTISLHDDESDSSGGNGDQIGGQNWRIQSFALKICAK